MPKQTRRTNKPRTRGRRRTPGPSSTSRDLGGLPGDASTVSIMQVNVIDRVTAEPWFTSLKSEDQKHLVSLLNKYPTAGDKAGERLELLDRHPHQFSEVQRQAQIVGAIELEGALRGDRTSVEKLPWFETLSQAERDAVLQTIQTNTRIQKALRRPHRGGYEKQVGDTNPWYDLLGRPLDRLRGVLP